MKPLCIDLFCGLGGWTEGFLAEGFEVIGFDIEEHVYGEHHYPAQLVIQDVRTLHGSQFRDADIIVASSPCQKYSYMAMPWTRAKELAKWYRDPLYPERLIELNELFDQPKRIQREASEAAGRHIPLVQENVRGAIPWVGHSQWHYGSYHLWGDVPALMPVVHKGRKNTGGSWFAIPGPGGKAANNNPDGRKRNNNPARGVAIGEGQKTAGLAHIRDGHGHTRHLTNQAEHDAIKNGGDWFGSGKDCSLQRQASSGSNARKAASAKIAKIPFPLAQWIARVTRESSLRLSA